MDSKRQGEQALSTMAKKHRELGGALAWAVRVIQAQRALLEAAAADLQDEQNANPKEDHPHPLIASHGLTLRKIRRHLSKLDNSPERI